MDFHHNQQEGRRLNDLMLPAPRECAQKEGDEVPKLIPENLRPQLQAVFLPVQGSPVVSQLGDPLSVEEKKVEVTEKGDEGSGVVSGANELETSSSVEVKERKRKVRCVWSDGETTALLEAHEALCAEKMTRHLRLDDWKDIEKAVNSKNTWPPKTLKECKYKIINTLKSKRCNPSSSEEARPCEQSDNARATEHGTGTRSTVPMAANQNYYSVLKGEYNARMAVPQTVDALEQGSLQEDVMKLLKEHHDAEDAEFSLHCERLSAINSHYQDKLVALLKEQGRIREEFLRKAFQSRFQQYQQFQSTNSMAPYQNSNPYLSAGGYNMEAAYGAEGHHGGYSGDAAPRADVYPTQASHYKSGGHPHGLELEPRYAGGRGYNAGSRQH